MNYRYLITTLCTKILQLKLPNFKNYCQKYPHAVKINLIIILIIFFCIRTTENQNKEN